MSFYKTDRSFSEGKPKVHVSDPYKRRYVIDDEGKGHWIEPISLPATDYDEDIDY